MGKQCSSFSVKHISFLQSNITTFETRTHTIRMQSAAHLEFQGDSLTDCAAFTGTRLSTRGMRARRCMSSRLAKPWR